MRGSWPCARSRSTTCEPMKPEPPVTRTFMRLPLRVGPVVERHAPVVLGDPVGVRQVDRIAPAGDGRARRRPCRSSARSDRRRCTCRGRRPCPRAAASRDGWIGSRCVRAASFFQATISSSALGLDEPIAAVNSFMPKVQAVRPRSRACRSCGTRARTRSARRCRRRACRPRRWRSSSSPRTTRCRRRPRCRRAGRSRRRRARARSPRAGRCPRWRQKSAICSISNARWPPMWTRNAARGLCSRTLRSKSVERHAEVLAVAVDELDVRAGVERRERRRHERVRRAENRLAADAGPLERGERGARPAVEGNGPEPVPGRPLTLELGGELALRPALGIEHAIPEPVQERAVAVVEPDRETARARSRGLGPASRTTLYPRPAGLARTERTLNRSVSSVPQPVRPASRSGRRPHA